METPMTLPDAPFVCQTSTWKRLCEREQAWVVWQPVVSDKE